MSCTKRIIRESTVVYRLLFVAHSISFVLCQFNCVLYLIFFIFSFHYYFFIWFLCSCLNNNVCGLLYAQMCYLNEWMILFTDRNCRYNSYVECWMTYAYPILCVLKLKTKNLKWSPISYSFVATLYTYIHILTISNRYGISYLLQLM